MPLTFQLHPFDEAAFEAACGTLLAVGDVYVTVGLPVTHKRFLVLDSALEEPLAALARVDPVVVPCNTEGKSVLSRYKDGKHNYNQSITGTLFFSCFMCT